MPCRYLEFVKVIILQDLDVIHAAFDHRVGARLTVFFKQVFFQRAGVHTDPDRTVIVPGGLDHLFDAGLVADIAGVDPQAGGPRFGGFDPAFVVKVDVGDDRHADFGNDLPECAARRFVGHRHTDDISTRFGGGVHLRDGRPDVSRQRIRHRLHADRCIAPHRHVADHDLTALAAVDVAPRADVIERHLARFLLRIVHVTT